MSNICKLCKRAVDEAMVVITRRHLSSNNSDRLHDVAMSFTVLLSATWPRCQRVHVDRCRSVADHRSWRWFPIGIDHPWWWRPPRIF